MSSPYNHFSLRLKINLVKNRFCVNTGQFFTVKVENLPVKVSILTHLFKFKKKKFKTFCAKKIILLVNCIILFV